MEINWSAILQVVGAAYLIASALVVLCTAVSAALISVWPAGSKAFATLATILGTVAAGLHTIVPGQQTVKRALTLGLFVLMVGSTQAACSAKNAVCPIIDAASKVCPYVTVLFEDGTEVQMPKSAAIKAGLPYREGLAAPGK
jgi:hypothetical protein